MDAPRALNPEIAAEYREKRLALADKIGGPRFQNRIELHPQIAVWAQQFLAGDAGNLIIGGQTGVGKTAQIWELYRRLTEADRMFTWLFKTSLQLASDLRPSDAEAEWIDKAGTVTLLMIDDLATEDLTQWQRLQIERIIDRRYAFMLPTLVTTNATDLVAQLGDRIASRLAQGCAIVNMRGADRRRAG